jgi:hypothetical protein
LLQQKGLGSGGNVGPAKKNQTVVYVGRDDSTLFLLKQMAEMNYVNRASQKYRKYMSERHFD